MTLRTRRYILLIFVIAFAVAAPLVLLNTAGYRYDWSRGQLEKTGIIKLDSRPVGAAVSISNRLQTDPTPTSIFRLLPGDYEIKIELAGYLPWVKTLQVDSGMTTGTGPVTLFRDVQPAFVAAADVPTAVFSDDGESAAFLKKSAGFTELVVRDLRTTVEETLARYAIEDCQTCRLQWSPTGSRLLFSNIDAASGRCELSIYQRSSLAASKATSVTLPLSPNTLRWSADGTKIIAAATGGVFAIDAATGEFQTVMLGTGIQDIAAKGREILVLQDKFPGVMLTKMPMDGTGNSEMISLLPPGRYSFESTGGRNLLISDSVTSQLFLVDFPSGKTNASYPAAHAVWQNSDDTGRLLLWNDYEIRVADPETKEQTVVTRLGSGINLCAWHPNGTDLFYATDSGITAIELDGREQHNTYDLAKLGGVGQFRVLRDGALLRFFGTIGNQSGLFERTLK
jgi:hypothetical protein